MYMLTSLDADSTFWFFALSRMVVGIGLPFMFIPITVASYDGIPAEKTDQASALSASTSESEEVKSARGAPESSSISATDLWSAPSRSLTTTSLASTEMAARSKPEISNWPTAACSAERCRRLLPPREPHSSRCRRRVYSRPCQFPPLGWSPTRMDPRRIDALPNDARSDLARTSRVAVGSENTRRGRSRPLRDA